MIKISVSIISVIIVQFLVQNYDWRLRSKSYSILDPKVQNILINEQVLKYIFFYISQVGIEKKTCEHKIKYNTVLKKSLICLVHLYKQKKFKIIEIQRVNLIPNFAA